VFLVVVVLYWAQAVLVPMRSPFFINLVHETVLDAGAAGVSPVALRGESRRLDVAGNPDVPGPVR
jgi:hypothetical protein